MENEYENKYLIKVLESVDERVTRIEASVASISVLLNKFVQNNAAPNSGEHNVSSTEDISNVLSTIRSGLFNVVNSDDDNTGSELASLISGLNAAKERLSDISSKISEGSVEPELSSSEPIND